MTADENSSKGATVDHLVRRWQDRKLALNGTVVPAAGIPPLMQVRMAGSCARTPVHTVYFLGGLTDNTPQSNTAASIQARQLNTDLETVATEEYGRYGSASSKNAARYVALIAAMTMAEERCTGEHCMFLLDVSNMYGHLTGKFTKSPDMQEYARRARTLYNRNRDYWSIGYYRSVHLNPARGVAERVLQDRCDVNLTPVERRWFMEFVMSRTMASLKRRLRAEQELPAARSTIDIKNFEDYIKLRHYPSRTRCPEEGVEAWAALVKGALSRVAAAIVNNNEPDITSAWMELLALPSSYLPANRPTKAVLQRLNDQRPFALTVKKKSRFNITRSPTAAAASPPSSSPSSPASSSSSSASPAGPATPGTQGSQPPHADVPPRFEAVAANDRHVDTQRSAGDLRTQRAVQREMNDFRAKAAVNLLRAQSNSRQPSFEYTCAHLQSKLESPHEIEREENDLDKHHGGPLPRGTVEKVLQNLGNGKARAIDGWGRMLLFQAICIDSSILDTLCIVLGNTLAGAPPLVLRILRASRFVGVPKDMDATFPADQPYEPDLRPVAVGNFFWNLLSIICLQLDDCKLDSWQYGVGVQRGTERCFHNVRRAHEAGKTILSVDARNAFGCASRARIHDVLARRHDMHYLQAFFSLAYDEATDLTVYGPNGQWRQLLCEEGVLQGSGPSSLLYALVQQEALRPVVEKWKRRYPEIDWFGYLDDLNIAVPEEVLPHLTELIRDVVRGFATIGIELSMKKSMVLAAPGTPVAPGATIANLQLVSEHTFFKVLGGSVSKSYDALTRKYIKRTDDFFNLLGRISLHSAILFTLLRICGIGRLTYYCSVTPPEHSREVCEHFDKRVIDLFTTLLEIPCEDEVSKQLIHDVAGAGIPCFSALRADLWNNSQRLNEVSGAVNKLPLVTYNFSNSAAFDSQTGPSSAAWLFYQPGPAQLTAKEFRIALGIRMRSNVLRTQLPVVCNSSNCPLGGRMGSQADIITHCFSRCSSMTGKGTVRRHDDIVHAIRSVAKRYGITSRSEPTGYFYDNGRKHRADIAFFTNPILVTDVTVVAPSPGNQGGAAAAEAAKRKRALHNDAVTEKGHIFVPCALESYGWQDASVSDMIKRLMGELPNCVQRDFVRTMRREISTALMRGNVNILVEFHQNIAKPYFSADLYC